jgi:thiamine biosynthesis lipoprotein
MPAVSSPKKHRDGARYVMGTLLQIRLTGPDDAGLAEPLDAAFESVQRLENLLSVYSPASEISRINAAAGRRPVRVSPETFDAVSQALHYARLTSGAFDPTVGAAMRLWGLDDLRGRRPADAEIRRTRSLVDWKKVRLDKESGSVFLEQSGMRLDLGGIGKGYALDRALERIRDHPGLDRLKFDFGGQLLFWSKSGVFPGETIVIESPAGGGRPEPFQIECPCSISTSSNGERFVLVKEKRAGELQRYGHLIDPHRGSPSRARGSVTVVAPTGVAAEALSTAHFLSRRADHRSLVLFWDGQRLRQNGMDRDVAQFFKL